MMLTTLDIQVCIFTISFLANLTFRGLCIVIYSYNKSQQDALFLKFIYKVLYMFRTGLLSIIKSISMLYTRNRYL
jgi:hypothetical protein